MSMILDFKWQSSEKTRRKVFIRHVAEHLRQHFPQRCAALSEDGVLSSIELGIQRARKYGLDSERDVVRYLNHMYALGFDFDTAYSWAGSILSDPRMNSVAKMDSLSEQIRQALPPKP